MTGHAAAYTAGTLLILTAQAHALHTHADPISTYGRRARGPRGSLRYFAFATGLVGFCGWWCAHWLLVDGLALADGNLADVADLIPGQRACLTDVVA